MILRARGVLPISQPLIENGAVVVSGGRIEAVGGWDSRPARPAGEEVDLGEVVLLPGLVNAHCHLDYTDLGGLLEEPKTFPDWIKALLALKAGWSYSEYARSWLNGARMLLHTGTTTVADIESVPELLPEVWDATPLRVISFLELINIRSWRNARQIVRAAELALGDLPKADGRVGLSPHAPYTTSPELLACAAATARRHGWPLTTHVAESREEFDMFARGQGAMFDWLAGQRDVSDCGARSPVRHLAQHGLLGREVLAVHANYLAEGDAQLLASHGASVVHCPRSHAFFRHERFPLEELLAAGVNLCLGTDSLASLARQRRQPPELNLFAEMRALAAAVPELSAESILRFATVNGARALGRQGQFGELTPQASADLIALPWRGGAKDVYETVLNHAGGIMASMIGGAWALAPRGAP